MTTSKARFYPQYNFAGALFFVTCSQRLPSELNSITSQIKVPLNNLFASREGLKLLSA